MYLKIILSISIYLTFVVFKPVCIYVVVSNWYLTLVYVIIVCGNTAVKWWLYIPVYYLVIQLTILLCYCSQRRFCTISRVFIDRASG